MHTSISEMKTMKNSLTKRKFMKSITFFLSAIVLFAPKAQSQVREPLELVQTIPLPGLHDGDFHQFQVDVLGQRLFLAAEENSVVEVIDMRTNKVIHTIVGLKAPHSMAYDTDSKKLFVVDAGGPSQVEIFDGTSFTLLGTIPMKAHAEPSFYDSANKLFYVGNGGKEDNEDYCLLSIIDTTSGKKVGDIRVDADRVDGMAVEKSGPRMFVNMYPKNAVAVIDREKRIQIATWSIADEGKGNVTMAFDEADHRLFVGVVNRGEAGKVIVLDSDSGKIVNSLYCVGQSLSQGLIYDAGSRRLYVQGVPFANVFQKIGRGDRYDLIGQVPTSYHAITAILAPQLNRYYMIANHHGDTQAEVLVYKVVP